MGLNGLTWVKINKMDSPGLRLRKVVTLGAMKATPKGRVIVSSS